MPGRADMKKQDSKETIHGRKKMMTSGKIKPKKPPSKQSKTPREKRTDEKRHGLMKARAKSQEHVDSKKGRGSRRRHTPTEATTQTGPTMSSEPVPIEKDRREKYLDKKRNDALWKGQSNDEIPPPFVISPDIRMPIGGGGAQKLSENATSVKSEVTKIKYRIEDGQKVYHVKALTKPDGIRRTDQEELDDL